MASLSERLTVEGKSLRTRFTVIVSLLFVQPFFVVSYILYREGLYAQSEYLYLAFFVLLLVLAGVIILRQVFDKFVMVTSFMKKAEAGEMVIMEIQKDTAELHDISVAFNTIMSRLEETTERLERQTAELQLVINERDRAEEALKESEEKFRSISASAPDAIIMMDNQGKISYWNEAAEKIFGYTAPEAMDKELHILIMPERYHEIYKKRFEHFRETGQGMAVDKTLELFALRNDGTEFPVEISLSAMKLKGRWHSAGILRDITERKHAEKELQKQLNEVERLNKLMVGRELKMEETRKKIRELELQVSSLKR